MNEAIMSDREMLFVQHRQVTESPKTCRGCAHVMDFAAPEHYVCKAAVKDDYNMYCIDARKDENYCGANAKLWKKSSKIKRFFQSMFNELKD